MPTAIDIAILPPEPVKSLAIEISKKLNPGDFHLNNVDILPHVTLGMGFVNEISKIKNQISKIVKHQKHFVVVVEKVEGRYLMCGKSKELYSLHKSICEAVEFVHLDEEELDKIRERTLRRAQGSISNFPYVEPVTSQTKEYTNNFKWRNAYENFVPHITVGWDDKVGISDKWLGSSHLPIQFIADKISICQLGNKNTCRKVLAEFNLKQG